jgi:hypothetical protein
MTLISMPQWPPISAEQYPEGMPEELVALLPNLHAACVMVLSAVYEHCCIGRLAAIGASSER